MIRNKLKSREQENLKKKKKKKKKLRMRGFGAESDKIKSMVGYLHATIVYKRNLNNVVKNKIRWFHEPPSQFPMMGCRL